MKNTKIAQTASYFIAFVALGLAMAALGPTLSGLAVQTGADMGAISYLFTMRSFGFLLGSLLSGRFYDRIPGHWVMAATVLAMSAMMALLPVASTLTLLLGVMLLLGTAEGALGVGGNALLVWVHGHRVAPYMNALHFFYGVGGVLSPLVIKLIWRFDSGMAATYIALALLILPVIPLLLFSPSPQSPRLAESQTGAEKINYKLVVLVALLLCMYIGAEVSFGSWMFTYALTLKLGDESVANNLTSLFWGALTAGRLICIPIAVRLRPRTILLADLLGCFVGVGIALWGSHSLAATTVATIIVGLSMGSIYPTALTFAERRMQISGQVMSMFIVGGSVGGMLVPMLIGQMFEAVGPRVVMITVLVDLLIAAAVYCALIVTSSPTRRAIAEQQTVSD